MALPGDNGAVGYAFGLSFDGVEIDHIQEISGLKMDQAKIEMKANKPDGKYVNVILPGRQQAGEITLTRALTANNSFEKWIKASHLGQMTDARKGAEVTVFDYEGNPLKRYVLTNAWPKTLEIGSLKAGDTQVLTEKLTVTFETLVPAD